MTVHRWNSRRCVKYTKYKSEDRALDMLRMTHRSMQGLALVKCPHCGAFHFVLSGKYFLGGWTPEQYIANLPPLFTPEHADTSRIYFNRAQR